MPRFQVRYMKAAIKGIARMRKRGKDFSRFEEVVTKLMEGEQLEERFHPHPLKGTRAKVMECHVTPDWLLIYRYEGYQLLLVDVGTHAELFDL